jgi:glycosyltransferase involved in cell wall biosynthesis
MSLRGAGIDLAVDQGRSSVGTENPTRVLLHDFAGHAFPMDLTRALGRRGHTVLHTYCESYRGGKGRFDLGPDDGDVSVVSLHTNGTFAKYSPLRRLSQELAYGRRFTALAEDFGPDVVVVCNMPIVVQRVIATWCRQRGVPWVFWLQDLYSVAIRATAAQRLGAPAGRVVGLGSETLERSLARQAAAIVPITEDFQPLLDRWGVARERCTVIENWAPLHDLPERPRQNAWRRAQGLADDRFLFLYSGTLGLKHRPELLYELAAQHTADADVVVISEGMGEARLREMLAARPLPNLRVLPFQPFEQFADILGAADSLVALLEPSAGTFSVPSKVLSYLCAGRPILAAIPAENLAARTIERSGAGLVVAPTDVEGFLLAAKQIRNDSRLRQVAGRCARAYAEATFDTDVVADRFSDVLDGALGRRQPHLRVV